MQVLPVLDLMNGQVVRGVAGQRETYRPVQSVLTASCDPLEVANAFQTRLGLSQLYVADLDAIQHQAPQVSWLRKLAGAFPGLWVDCGLRTLSDIPAPLESLAVTFIAGLETLNGPHILKALCELLGPERVVFSLDLKHGLPMGDVRPWRGSSPRDIAREAIKAGVRTLIVLDLAQVGMEKGVSTLSLCQHIKQEFPNVTVITGGGIRNEAELVALKQAGIDGVLIASALHNGSLGLDEFQRLEDV